MATSKELQFAEAVDRFMREINDLGCLQLAVNGEQLVFYYKVNDEEKFFIYEPGRARDTEDDISL